jgi:hypothetical protein
MHESIKLANRNDIRERRSWYEKSCIDRYGIGMYPMSVLDSEPIGALLGGAL